MCPVLYRDSLLLDIPILATFNSGNPNNKFPETGVHLNMSHFFFFKALNYSEAFNTKWVVSP